MEAPVDGLHSQPVFRSISQKEIIFYNGEVIKFSDFKGKNQINFSNLKEEGKSEKLVFSEFSKNGGKTQTFLWSRLMSEGLKIDKKIYGGNRNRVNTTLNLENEGGEGRGSKILIKLQNSKQIFKGKNVGNKIFGNGSLSSIDKKGSICNEVSGFWVENELFFDFKIDEKLFFSKNFGDKRAIVGLVEPLKLLRDHR